MLLTVISTASEIYTILNGSLHYPPWPENVGDEMVCNAKSWIHNSKHETNTAKWDNVHKSDDQALKCDIPFISVVQTEHWVGDWCDDKFALHRTFPALLSKRGYRAEVGDRKWCQHSTKPICHTTLGLLHWSQDRHGISLKKPASSARTVRNVNSPDF